MSPQERARQIDAEEFRRDSERALERALAYSKQKQEAHRRQSLINMFGDAGRTMPLWSTFPTERAPTRRKQPDIAPPMFRPRAPTHTVNGMTKTAAEWAEQIGITAESLKTRARKLGSMEAAVLFDKRSKKSPTRPEPKPRKLYTVDGRSLTLAARARRLGINYPAFFRRVERHGIAHAVTMPTDDQRGKRPRPSNDNAPTTSTTMVTAPELQPAPGVSLDLQPKEETGAWAVLQETPNITFSQKAKSA